MSDGLAPPQRWIAIAAITFFRNGFDYRKGSNPLADVRTATMAPAKAMPAPPSLNPPAEIYFKSFQCGLHYQYTGSPLSTPQHGTKFGRGMNGV